MFAAVGVQPNHVAEARPDDWTRIVELSALPRVVAIGETGLDRYWDDTPFPQQQEWFDRHLSLAQEQQLPVVIHCRNCEADILDQLRRTGRPARGVIHSFTGNRDHAEAFLELGLHLSFAGMVTFSNKSLDTLREAASTVPLDRILVETDSPVSQPSSAAGAPQPAGSPGLDGALPLEPSSTQPGRICKGLHGERSTTLRPSRRRSAVIACM